MFEPRQYVLNADEVLSELVASLLAGRFMLDLAALAALLVFFGLGALFVRGCDLI